MGDALKYLLHGFQSSYDRAAEDYMKQKHLDDILQRETDKEKQEQATDERRRSIVRQLISGEKPEVQLTQTPLTIERTGLPFTLKNMTNQYLPVEPKITRDIVNTLLMPEDETQLLSSLDNEGFNLLNDINKYKTQQIEQRQKVETDARLRKLITGDVSDEEKRIILSNLDEKSLQRYKSFQEVTKPDYEIDYTHKDGIYSKNRLTGELTKVQDVNPLYIPKHVGSVEGYNSEGTKTLEVMYDNGDRQVFHTGLNKKNEVSDEEEYNKAIKGLYSASDALQQMRSTYMQGEKNQPENVKAFSRDRINNFAYNQEQYLYSILPEKTRVEVNNFYNDVKQKAKEKGIPYQDMLDNPSMRDAFTQWVDEHFVNGKLSNDATKAQRLRLWGQFKFGYIHGEKK